MVPSIPFYTLVNLVYAEEITNEKNRTLDLPLQINKVTSELEKKEFFAENYNPIPEIMFTQKTDRNIEGKPQFWKNCKVSHKSNQSICFCKQGEDEEKKRNCYSRSKSPIKSFNQLFKTYRNQIHP